MSLRRAGRPPYVHTWSGKTSRRRGLVEDNDPHKSVEPENDGSGSVEFLFTVFLQKQPASDAKRRRDAPWRTYCPSTRSKSG